MNKLKLLYDVAKTMKDLEQIRGTLEAEVNKDNVVVLTLKNNFEKSQAGRVTADSTITSNFKGENLTRQSKTELTCTGAHHHGPCHFFKAMHRQHCEHSHGIKGFWQRLTALFGIIGSLKIEEHEKGVATVSLDLTDIPEDLRTAMLARFREKHRHHQDSCIADCQNVDIESGNLTITVNAKNVIEKLTVTLQGKAGDGENTAHIYRALAGVQLTC